MTTLTSGAIAERIAMARAIRAKASPEKVVGAVERLFALDNADIADEFVFPARSSTSRERIFGGQVIAQAMHAAALTVDAEKPVHSLHAYFLRGGDETKELHFRVHRDFDGRSFSNRRVVVRQNGKVIFNLTASFQLPADGPAHQVAMPDLLPPEDCWTFEDFIADDPGLSDEAIANMARQRPFETRSHRPGGTGATRHYMWFKVAAPIGDDIALHRGFLAFASDMGLLSSSLLPHGMTWTTPGLFTTSLDHAMWFHADVRVDEWLVYVMDSDWTGESRGINRGSIFRRDGTLVATAMQEGLVRYTQSG